MDALPDARKTRSCHLVPVGAENLSNVAKAMSTAPAPWTRTKMAIESPCLGAGRARLMLDLMRLDDGVTILVVSYPRPGLARRRRAEELRWPRGAEARRRGTLPVAAAAGRKADVLRDSRRQGPFKS